MMLGLQFSVGDIIGALLGDITHEWQIMPGLQLVLSKTNRIDDTKYNI